MATTRTGSLLLTAALLLGIGLSSTLIGGTAGPQDGTGANEVGFISLSKVLNAHKGLMAAEQQINEFRKKGLEELTRIKEEIEKLKSEMAIFSRESKEYMDAQSAIERKELQAKQKERDLLRERDDMLGQAFRNAYADIERAVQDYAREQGLKGVFSSNLSINEVQTSRPDDLLKWVSMVDVVWHDDRLDISNAIITIINGS
jgi:Skp family chaperone for outer membrane proteins